MTGPTVDIIIPHLGRPEGLKRCLASINKLQYPQELIHTFVIEGEDTVPNKVAKALKYGCGEWVVFAANDMEFEPDSLALNLEAGVYGNKALVAFDSGVRNSEGWICEHFMIRRDFLPQIGSQIFDTDFHHVGVDDLLWHKCAKLGQAIVGPGRIKHYHFSRIGSGIEQDEVNKKGWEHAEADRKLLEKKLKEL
jgi:hypothetical protein